MKPPKVLIGFGNTGLMILQSSGYENRQNDRRTGREAALASSAARQPENQAGAESPGPVRHADRVSSRYTHLCNDTLTNGEGSSFYSSGHRNGGLLLRASQSFSRR